MAVRYLKDANHTRVIESCDKSLKNDSNNLKGPKAQTRWRHIQSADCNE